MIYTIDAKDKSLGRIASETALLLRGKNTAGFSPNKLSSNKVKVINLEKAHIGEKKLKQKKYKSFSGYPGGLKELSMEKVLEKKGIDFLFKKAVRGMLPKNRLQNEMMKNLITE